MTGPTCNTAKHPDLNNESIRHLTRSLPFRVINLEPLGFWARSIGLDVPSIPLDGHRSEREFMEAGFENLETAERLEPDMSRERWLELTEHNDAAVRLGEHQTARATFNVVSRLLFECEATGQVSTLDDCPFAAVPCDGVHYGPAVNAAITGGWTPVLTVPTAVLVYCFAAPVLKDSQ